MNIYQAAVRLLNDEDIEKITVRSIVKEANSTIGGFYHYYQSKYDVYRDAFYFMNDYFENIVAINLPKGSLWEKLEYYFSQYHLYNTQITSFKLYQTLTKFVADATITKKTSTSAAQYGYFRVLTSIITQGQSSGEITPEESAEDIALFFLNSLRGLYRHWVLMEGEYDIEHEYLKTVHKLLSVYMVPPATVKDMRVSHGDGSR